MGGFASHSHTYFCTACWIKKANLATPEAFVRGAFACHTNAEQHRLGEEYLAKSNPHARAAFVKDFATRFTQLACLPYFDLVRQVVIDPMHNLFLGLVKMHFYYMWVKMGILQEKHELCVLHDMLRDFTLLYGSGKLPKDIGEPSGGSLTADQWRLLAVEQGPIIRIALEESLKQEKRKKDAEQRAKKKADKARATRKGKERADANAPPVPTTHDAPSASDPVAPTNATAPKRRDQPYAMHPDDPANFLMLSEALHLLCQDEISVNSIMKADTLLRQYCADLIKLYGTAAIRPNHYYATHITEFILDYGPLHTFWSFLFERLNKLLKSYNTNNHGDGELETTFFTEFHRTCQVSRVIYNMANKVTGSPQTSKLAKLMLKTTQDDRGTVAGLVAWVDEVDKAHNEAHPVQTYAMSPRRKTSTLSSQGLYDVLLHHFHTTWPSWHIHSQTGCAMDADSLPLEDAVIFFNYVQFGKSRFYASNLSGQLAASLVKVYMSTTPGMPQTSCAQLTDIFQFQQNLSSPPMWFGHVRWFKPWSGPREPIWDQFATLNVRLWNLEEYEDPFGAQSAIVELTRLKGGIGRKVVTVGEENHKVWATVGLEDCVSMFGHIKHTTLM
ncbi:hypothetical protein A0H81_00065 [Grifola frondosa]|uniref:Uncharacterized protein n=1 Tax=Grifola frondosa TaxID=5627 RepID=A0A1C7MRV1_GRIFR|nr:hypothetical protein A0H81_00065 [Grifola frondosa]